ncbi:methionyl-tRNA formyltransferase, partial [Magnetospirillum sp. SS-4]|uniref:methionyl-tRNA formyltransferase n=1 Tax=Magnetospirillum sp. SS-4 TaxID=2681465 RepID=UPI001C2D1455
VCGWYRLLDNEILSLAPNGMWGVHNSLLPKYRGGSPLVWSIINGDDTVGSTVFKISEGVDNGEILFQISITNNTNDDIKSLLNKIESALTRELPRKWESLVTGQAQLSIQDENKATYCGQRIEDDGQIDWYKNSKEIHNFIRAQSDPYPCAFTYYKRSKIHILSSNIIEITYHGTPGQVLRRDTDSITVACGNSSAIIITRIRVDNVIYNPNSLITSTTDRFTREAAPHTP